MGSDFLARWKVDVYQQNVLCYRGRNSNSPRICFLSYPREWKKIQKFKFCLQTRLQCSVCLSFRRSWMEFWFLFRDRKFYDRLKRLFVIQILGVTDIPLTAFRWHWAEIEMRRTCCCFGSPKINTIKYRIQPLKIVLWCRGHHVTKTAVRVASIAGRSGMRLLLSLCLLCCVALCFWSFAQAIRTVCILGLGYCRLWATVTLNNAECAVGEVIWREPVRRSTGGRDVGDLEGLLSMH